MPLLVSVRQPPARTVTYQTPGLRCLRALMARQDFARRHRSYLPMPASRSTATPFLTMLLPRPHCDDLLLQQFLLYVTRALRACCRNASPASHASRCACAISYRNRARWITIDASPPLSSRRLLYLISITLTVCRVAPRHNNALNDNGCDIAVDVRL